MSGLKELHDLGQSTWLNYLRNSFIRSGELADRVRLGVQGVTANAQVYERAVAGGGDYDAAIRRAMSEGKPARSIHEALMADDIQRAADVLLPIFQATDRRDGFVSFELEPSLLGDVTNAVAEVRRISHHVDRANVMVEIPATPVGIETIRALVADGVSINSTHLLPIAGYERIGEAYLAGLT
jgi:transaldolase